MNCDAELLSRPFSWYDLCLRDGTVETLHAKCGDNDYYFEVLYNSENARLGIWLSKIPRRVLLEAVNYIFKTHKEVKRIGYRYSLEPLGVSSKGNHFKFELPDKTEEIISNLSKSERKHLKNRQNRLSEAGKITINDYQADWDNPDVVEAFSKFFEFKHITHGTNCNLTARQYIQVQQVSNLYVLRCNNNIIAVKLSCEQCPIVGGENTSYSMDYAKYYPGIIMQYTLLSELVKKGKTELFIGGSGYQGQRKYKQHFNSIEETVYHGIIYRSLIEHIVHKIIVAFKTFIKTILPVKLVAVIRAITNGTKVRA